MTSMVSSVPKQRLVFFMKHLLQWFESEAASDAIKAEACKSLTSILPSIGDLYGEHWIGMLSIVESVLDTGFIDDEGVVGHR